MLKKVSYPVHVFKGLQPLSGSHPLSGNIRVFGLDTETCRGKAHTVQIAGPHDSTVLYVDDNTIFPEFWSWIRGRLRFGGVNLAYVHNLNFDLRVIFALHHVTMYEQFSEISISLCCHGHPPLGDHSDCGGVPIEVLMLFGKVNKADIKQGRQHLQIFDSYAFTMTSLARSCKMFKIKEGKLKAPKDLGKKRLRSPEFTAYALQDAVAVRALGLRIMEFHKAYEVRPAITLPAYAGKVFRRHFLGLGESIPFPPVHIVKAAELSYHGGKNGYYLDGPEVLEDVYEVDISSAYPFAMRELPPLTKGKYKGVKKFHPGLAGIYKISSRTGSSIYPLIYDHAFRKLPPRTDFKGLWITGYELAHVLKTDTSLNIDGGYVWKPARGAVNPFARYVDHFYAKKQASDKDDPFYALYKLCLNSLYGKLVATTPVRTMEQIAEVKRLKGLGVAIPEGFTINERYDAILKKYVQIKSGWRAGSMYNPFWGSMITGHTRAYIYSLEKKLSAIHTATDSVKSITPHPPVPGLGGLKVEAFGRCYLFRNKLYLHLSRSGEYCGHRDSPGHPKDFIRYPKGHKKEGLPYLDSDGQHLCKYALHGFKGRLWELWDNRKKFLRSRSLSYDYIHVVGLREGLIRGETPCDFVQRHETISI